MEPGGAIGVAGVSDQDHRPPRHIQARNTLEENTMQRRNTEPADILLDHVTTIEATNNVVDWEVTFWDTPSRARTVTLAVPEIATLFADGYLYIEAPLETGA